MYISYVFRGLSEETESERLADIKRERKGGEEEERERAPERRVARDEDTLSLG